MNLTFAFKHESLSEAGEITGYASVFHTLDAAKDIVMPGAFKKSLNQWHRREKWPKMLWNHDPTCPIGTWTKMEETSHGLYVEGKILTHIQKGNEVYQLLKSGAIEGLSIGYRVNESTFDPTKKAKILKQLDLIEVSFVTFAANPDAQILSVKTDKNVPLLALIQHAKNNINQRIRRM
jgi:HK97 family phage prohead protease